MEHPHNQVDSRSGAVAIPLSRGTPVLGKHVPGIDRGMTNVPGVNREGIPMTSMS